MSPSNAGCSPVRAVTTSDGMHLYVSAPGDNQILDFAADKLATNPAHAFLRSFASNGPAPVGLALTGDETKLLIANFNRFGTGNGNITVLDVATGDVLQKIVTGNFPRNFTIDQETVYPTVYTAGRLLVLSPN